MAVLAPRAPPAAAADPAASPQGGCATFLCQPLDVLKTRLMNSQGEYQVSSPSCPPPAPFARRPLPPGASSSLPVALGCHPLCHRDCQARAPRLLQGTRLGTPGMGWWGAAGGPGLGAELVSRTVPGRRPPGCAACGAAAAASLSVCPSPRRCRPGPSSPARLPHGLRVWAARPQHSVGAAGPQTPGSSGALRAQTWCKHPEFGLTPGMAPEKRFRT